VHCRVA